MTKQNKWKMLISSLLTLTPMAIGLMLWDKFPGISASHWSTAAKSDGLTSAGFFVIGLPLILLAFHWFCIIISLRDPKMREQSDRILGIVLWIIPAASLFVSLLCFAVIFQLEINLFMVLFVLLGLMFIVLGNIMPKIKQNSYMGIKVKWTLESEENWFATHRMASKIFVGIGLVFLLCALLPKTIGFIILLAGILPAAFAPMIYSYCYYKKQLKEGYVPREEENKKKSLRVVAVSLLSSLLVVVVLLVMLGGSIEVEMGETSFIVKTTPHDDFTVDYERIDDIKLIEEKDSAERLLGYGTPKLSMGLFQNDRFGRHTRYTYNNVHCYVAVYSGDAVLIVNTATVEETRQLYQDLLAKINN